MRDREVQQNGRAAEIHTGLISSVGAAGESMAVGAAEIEHAREG